MSKRKENVLYSTANHVEKVLMVVQRLLSAIIHNRRNCIVHDEAVRVAEDIVNPPFTSVE